MRLRNRDIETFLGMAYTLAGPGNFEEKAADLLEEVARIVEADLATLRVLDENEESLRLEAAGGPALRESSSLSSLLYEEGISLQALQKGNCVVANDYVAHPNSSPAAISRGVKSLLSLPIMAGERTAGVLNVISKEVNHFTPEYISLLKAIGGALGLLLQYARLREESAERASEIERLNEFNHRMMSGTMTPLAIVTDRGRSVASVNRAFCQTLGLTDADV